MNKIDNMRIAGSIGHSVFKRVAELIKPGISTAKIDEEIEQIIINSHAFPECKGYHGVPPQPPFPCASCISINEEVCHGIPGKRELKPGDLVSVDIVIRHEDHLVDACRTYEVGVVSKKADQLNYWTKTALARAVRSIKAGVCWNDIAKIIEITASSKGLSVIRAITGHGIGNKMHEEPLLCNYVRPENEAIILEENQTICVEPMFSIGKPDVELHEDKWTLLTKDRSPTSHWEHCLLVTKEGCEVFL